MTATHCSAPATALASVTGLGHATPVDMPQQGLWREFFADHYGEDRRARWLWRRSGVTTRHGVADPRLEDLSRWGTEARMRRFAAEAPPLGKSAVEACLADAGLQAEQVGLLAVASCTGYTTPGLDVLLARDLGMSSDTQRLHIGHMGCYAAIPGLSTVADAAVARGKVGLLVCAELPSLHIQPPSDDPQQVVAHSLFSDAVTAVAVTPGSDAGLGRRRSPTPGLALADIAARTDPATAEHMTWDVTDLGFRMGLSPEVPKVLQRHVAPAVDELLARHGLTRGEVAAWAVHPGGPQILEVVAERLGLDEAAMGDSRAVLAEHGNCSSATVVLVLERLLATQDLGDGQPVVCLAFGPGLTLYAALLWSRR
jgi:predicted naringenin-chalcone synthase